jgi:hypothetical protein
MAVGVSSGFNNPYVPHDSEVAEKILVSSDESGHPGWEEEVEINEPTSHFQTVVK